MLVTAQHTLDLGMLVDHLLQGLTASATLAVHEWYAGPKRRMMHEDDRRLVGRFRQPRLEPLPLGAAYLAAFHSGDRGIEPDQA